MRGNEGQQIRSLPPTPGNTAKAGVTIPVGFRRVHSNAFGGPVWPIFTSS